MGRRLLFTWGLIVAVVACGASLVAFAAGNSAGEAKPFAVSVTISHTQRAGEYECDVLATDGATQKIVFAPTLFMTSEEPAKASLSDGNGLLCKIEVHINRSGSEATYTFVASQTGKVLQQEKGKVAVK